VAGCGGGSEDQVAADTGKMQISVRFPAVADGPQPAVIYADTNSITVDILASVGGEPVISRTTINRPDPQGGEVSVTIADIPVGDWILVVRGWELEDGGGKLLSTAQQMVTITTGTTTEKSIVMDGWPYELILTASTNPILVDQRAYLTVTAKDADGNTLLRNFAYTFESSNTGVCTVTDDVLVPAGTSVSPLSTDYDAQVDAVARGQATITATLVGEVAEASADVKTAEAPVTGSLEMIVDPNIDEVVVTPSTAELAIDETVTITAEARYKGGVVEDIVFDFASTDSAIVSVSQVGDDTAEITGESGGTATVTAAQPYTSASGTCEVTVPYGNLNVIISETD
ncbi:MAG: hypothetical protein ACLFWB_10155, partial [Armatimonadota bacterium]